MLLSGTNVTIWNEMYHLELMLSSRTKCYHLGPDVIVWGEVLSSGTKCYHPGQNVIIWDEMLSSGANVMIWR